MKNSFLNKKQISQFFGFLKNPLWIVVILLIVISFLLWNISLRIGHDYILKSETGKTKKSTGLYKAIYNTSPDTVYYGEDLEKIIDRLGWIDSKLNKIEWNTRY